MIKIIREPDIHLTEDELLRYRRAYNDFCRYHVLPPSFEAFVRSQPFRDRSYTDTMIAIHRLLHARFEKLAASYPEALRARGQ